MLGGEVGSLFETFELRSFAVRHYLIARTYFFAGLLLVVGRYCGFGVGYAIIGKFNFGSFVLIVAVGGVVAIHLLFIGDLRLLRHVQLRTAFGAAGSLAWFQDAVVAEVLPLDLLIASF